MRKPVMLGIIGLSVALWLCLLSGGVEVEHKVLVKVGGKVWFGKGSKNIKGASNSECELKSEAQSEKP